MVVFAQGTNALWGEGHGRVDRRSSPKRRFVRRRIPGCGEVMSETMRKNGPCSHLPNRRAFLRLGLETFGGLTLPDLYCRNLLRRQR